MVIFEKIPPLPALAELLAVLHHLAEVVVVALPGGAAPTVPAVNQLLQTRDVSRGEEKKTETALPVAARPPGLLFNSVLCRATLV